MASEKTNKKETPSYFKYVLVLWILFLLGIGLIVLLFHLIANGTIGYMPELTELQNPKNKNATEIYSSDNQLIGRYFYSSDNRVPVDFSELSPNLVNALLATEDERYYEHSGVDGRALLRSIIVRGILRRKSGGGGSTITQQLAKQCYTEQVASNSLQRALQKPIEWVIAVQLERYYTKKEIVAMYFNKFDFVNNAVGIKSASSVYFNTSPDKLSVEQAATLVGMCQNPAYYNPVRFNERTKERRNVVLSQMERAGYLTEHVCDSLQQLPLVLDYQKVDHKLGLVPYFREYLRRMLMAKKPVRSNYASWQDQKFYEDSLAWVENPLFGWCNKNTKPDGTAYNIYTDGLKIYTTIDSRLQRYAEEAVNEHIQELQRNFFKEKKGRKTAPFTNQLTDEEVESIMNRSMKQSDRYYRMKAAKVPLDTILKVFKTPIPMQLFTYKGYIDTLMSPLDSIRYVKHYLRCGFMSMSPTTGHIKAYVGGPNFGAFQYDMVSDGKRQVGSTIKPYLYTLAMEEGMSPCDQVPNLPQTFVIDEETVWSPRNDDHEREGEMVTLRWGLAKSNNNVTAYLMKQFSPKSLVNLMHSFGITSYLDPVVALCLGPSEISVKEMVSAYTTFANKGIRVTPMYVTRIEDNNGNIISEFTPKMYEVVSEETSYKMLSLLKAVTTEGTGLRLRGKYAFRNEIAGKTGTTQNNSDGWFMGVVPNLVSGVWVGGEDRAIHFDGLKEGQGANMALPIWALYMQKVYADPEVGISDKEVFDIPEQYRYNCSKINATQVKVTATDGEEEEFF